MRKSGPTSSQGRQWVVMVCLVVLQTSDVPTERCTSIVGEIADIRDVVLCHNQCLSH